MIDQDKLVNEFAELTITTKDEARLSLEKANWDLKLAVTQFHTDDKELSRNNTSSHSKVKSIPKSSMANPIKQSSHASRSTRSSNIRTLNDVASRDTDNGDQTQNLFAGGEKSGMFVQDPSKQGKSKRLVEEILKKAATNGSTSEEAGDDRHSKPSYFTGSGHRLGSEEESSVAVNDHTDKEAIDEPLELVTRHLTFWRNGFSVDDGPLLRYDDPANSAMLNAINSGRAPLSLLNVRHGQPVDVKVSQRQDKDYVSPPKAPPKPFEGNGNRLGSPETAPLSPAAAAVTARIAPTEVVEIDSSQSTTSIQIRLMDGSRLVTKFNLTHTVNDLRRYIDSQQHQQQPYILQTTFPVKQLTNGEQSLKDAGLLNSVIIQRLV